MFSHLLLIACICMVLTLVLYFFYWNRFIAFVIGHAIRILFWNQEGSSVWVEIGSIHFSLLTGRILLKDVRYHSSNQTIKVVKGQIQWRYWIRRPTSEEQIISVPGEHVKATSRLWSCRIQLSFQGVEWFLYNRTAAYDHILDQLERVNRPTSRSSSHQRFFGRFSRQDSVSPFYPPSIFRASMQVPKSVKKAMAWFRHQLPTLDPKDLLPLGIDIHTGAIILGNPSTPNLLVAEFQDALGTFGIAASKSRYDLYKHVFDLKFQKSLIRLVHNEDYVDPMTTLGAIIHDRVNRLLQRLDSDATLRKPPFYQSYRNFFKLWRQIKLYDSIADYFKRQRFNRQSQPLKKSNKVADEETPIGVDFSTLEYAIERKILETPMLELSYYVDVVGEVPSQISTARYAPTGVHDIGNCDADPEWGIDLVMHGGFLRYGPWADRQRAELQRTFFPPVYVDSDVTPILRPGDKRRWTALHIFIELRDETTLHIPFREASKDWQWDGVVDVPERPRARDAASINVVVGDRSSVNYVVPMVVGPTGYEPTVEVHLDTVSITSSLNDIRLVSAESCRIRCEFPTPKCLVAERTWTIAAYLRQPTLFLLRDHINMFTDLGKDWVSGPPADYQKFIPMIYVFKLEMHHFELNLYANDQNIVDRPLIKDENALVTLKGSQLRSLATIPSNTFRPESTLIPFNITAPDIMASFSLPRWNTHALHAQKQGVDVMKSDYLNIRGSYRYFSEVKEELVEQLKLQFHTRGAVFRAYGWSIRYFMVLRDNYLGSFTHFQTLSEYLEKRQRGVPVGDPIASKYRHGKNNMLQVEITLRAENSKFLLPLSLIGDMTHSAMGLATPVQNEDLHSLTLKVPEIQLDLRIHDHYMDMSLNMDTATGEIRPSQLTLSSVSGSATSSSKEIFMLDGIDITAHRLFGPQPRTATYLCIWEIALGDMKASMSAIEVKLLGKAVNSFRMNFVDIVNAPADEFLPGVDPDVTFCKLTLESLEMTVKAPHVALLVTVPQGIKLDNNNLGTRQYHKLTSLIVPQISVDLLINASTERDAWLEAAEVTFDICLDLYASPAGYRTMTSKQMAFVANQDKMTGRAKRIFRQLRRETSDYNASHRNSVYLPQPALPNPVNGTSSVAPDLGSIPRPSSPPRKFSHLDDPSDSEGEGVSEADRDARLARTRTSTPVPERREEDAAMSSGDESDDADLTEAGSAEEDWSDVGDSLNEQPIGQLMTFYSPLVRHFVAKRPQMPVGWGDEAFEMTRDGAPFIHRYSGVANDDNFRNAVPLSIPECIPENKDFNTLRVKFCKTGRIVTTPLLLQAALFFEEDIKHIIPEPETCIDSLLIDCLAHISARKTSKYLAFQVDLPHATGQHIQHVNVPEGNPNIARKMESTAIPSNLDITSLLNLSIHGLRFSGVLGGENPAVKASIDQAIATLDVSIDKRTLPSISPDSIILELLISTAAVESAHSHFWLKLGDISVKVGNQGPELVTTTLTAFLSMGTLCRDFIYRLRSYHIETTRRVIHNLLKTSEQQGPVIDPLSTIQPSYLVQKGMPHLLRTDVTFRLLYHLRSCLLNLDNPLGISPHQTVGGVDSHDLSSAIESRLALLDQDAASVGDLTSVDPIFFGEETRSNAENNKQPLGTMFITSLSVRVMQATVTILTPAGGPPTRLTANDLTVDVQSKLLNLIQTNTSNLSTPSQTSLHSKATKIVQETVIFISLGNTALIVTPHLMHFAQHILRVKRRFTSDLNDASQHGVIREPSSNQSFELWSLKIFGGIQHLHIQAAAENLVLVFGINGMQASSAFLVTYNQFIQSMNQGVLFDEIYFQARSPADHSKDSDQDILAALVFRTCRMSAVSRPEAGSRRNLKFALILDSMRLQVPRSALRLYRFIGEWRADYLPGIEAAVKALLSEYKAGPSRPLSPAPSHLSRWSHVLQIHCSVQRFEISLQVMHGTWLSLEVHQIISYFDSSGALRAGWSHAFGLQVKSMVVNVSSKPIARDAASSSRVKLTLPPLSLAGHSDGYHIYTLILLEFIDLKLKPSHWDTLLSVQQKFGQDFNDLVALIQKSRQKRFPPPKAMAPRQSQKSFAYEAHWKMRGFRIGFEGMSSTVVLECQDINGTVSNAKGWSWDLGVSDLALSLAPRFNRLERALFNRDHRSAFVTIDFRINGLDPDLEREKTLELSVSKMHAVMQPSSIGEFGDFIDNLQAEMLERQEERASQMAAFKEKTQSILKTFDVNVGEVPLEQRSWITNLIVNVSIRSIGVAFPLTHSEELVLPVSKESFPVRAFLFAIKSIEFGTRRGETGQAAMQRLSFQFVSRFRQSVPDDFTAERHYTRNCLLYPEMKAQLRSSSSGPSRQIWVKADVSGFLLDIDSTIPKYIFALVDVYRRGKERVERLSVNVPSTPFSSIPIFEDSKPVLLEERYSAVPTSHVFMNLVFHSGKVRLFSTAASSLFKNKILSNRFSDLSDEHILGLGAEVFNLPVVSVWGEYRATPATRKLSKVPENLPSVLMFNSTVHSSSNVLRPTLLPFLTELVDHLENRMRKVTSDRSQSPVVPPPLLPSTSLPRPDEGRENTISSLQICFSLQIDKSKLELTCQPDVNVIAGLHWESGGFVINVSPGASEASLFGSVGGLTVGLKHGFLSEDCVRLNARNLAFSISFKATEPGRRAAVNTISVVLDTEILGGVRFSRLQDVLCFKAVWLDRIPVFNKQSPLEIKTLTLDTSASVPVRDVSPKRTLSTVVLVRIREVKLEVDLGQSITKLNLGLRDSVFEAHLTDDLNEVVLFVGDVSLVANGNMSGHARVSSVFQTIRRSESAILDDNATSKMLELRLTSGPLIAALDSDQQQLLHYRAEPLEVEIVDDWSQLHLPADQEFRPLQLSFTVSCPEIIAAATIGAIPKLLSYINKFKANLDAQRQGAFRESQTFRAIHTPKPDNPLSAVAEAMLQSARSRFKEADSTLSYTILQHMSLRLDVLRLIVFPRSMRDLEIAHFIGREVQANLNSQVGSSSAPAKRDIHLSFSSMVISKYTQFARQTSVPVESLEEQAGPDWPMSLFKDANEATIVGLPSMKMHMTSEESTEETTTILMYDFHSEFVRRAGMKEFEDIYITLNISLYSWLTVLRKNLTREMEQVRATEDWRVSMSTVSTAINAGGSQRKKKVPEPLSLWQSSRSATLPSAGTAGLSPFTPAYIRHGITEQSRTAQTSRESLSPVPPALSPQLQSASSTSKEASEETTALQDFPKRLALTYKARRRHIERLTMRQLGEATPDVMHPFFMKKAGFNLEDSLPQYVHEYATIPLEEIMEVLLKLYSQQLLTGPKIIRDEAEPK